MAYQEMTLEELKSEVKRLENYSNEIWQRRLALKEEMLEIQKQIDEVNRWVETKRPPGDPNLTQNVGT